MALFKIADRFPNYKDQYFDGNDIKGTTVYADADDEKIGGVHDVLVDDDGRARYLVIDTGFWIFGKKVLLPIGRCKDTAAGDRIYATGLTKQQVEDLPDYPDDLVVDYSYEEQVRSIYSAPPVEGDIPVETSASVEAPATKGYFVSPVPQPAPKPTSQPAPQPAFPQSQVEPAASATPTAPTKISVPAEDKRAQSRAHDPAPLQSYQGEADLYTADGSHRLRLYEERLVAHKRRQKTGEVTVTKQIVTEQVEGSVTVQKERIVIVIESVPGVTQVNVAGEDVKAGSGARAELHADQIEIRKEPVVRQEVTIRKAVDEEVVTVRDTVRREEIMVHRDGEPEVDFAERSDTSSQRSAPERSSPTPQTDTPQTGTPQAAIPQTSAPQATSAYLIFNPVAGQGDPEKELDIIRSTLKSKMQLDIHKTTPEVGAEQLARQAVEAGVEAVLVSGGDGTISGAANALIGSDIPLGIISRGTANAFANALGLSENVEEACQTILKGKTKQIDVATCNDKPMVLLAGIGFEAEAIEKADRTLKNKIGRLAYVFSSFRELRNIEKFKAKIETDDNVIELDATAITVANAAPPTSILAQGPAGILADDGYLDLTVATADGFTSALSAAFRLLRSTINDDAVDDRDDIGFLRSRRISITTEPQQKVVLDGEIIGHTPVNIECVPLGLTVFAADEAAAQPDESIEQLPNAKVTDKS